MDDDSIFDQFNLLYQARQLADCNRFNIKDGIIQPELYYAQPIRILIIGKEHNFIKPRLYPDGYEGDYRVWWKDNLNYTFSLRISEWSFGILDNFETPYEAISREQKIHSLRSLAFINVKKTGGRSKSNPNTILAYISASRELLHKQINQINPEVILCCFRHDLYVEALFDIVMTKSSFESYNTGFWQGRKVINTFHPSSRKNKQYLYNKLAHTFKES